MARQDLPYRDSVEALRSRKAAIDADLAKLRAHTAELSYLKGREQALLREQAAIDERLRAEGQKRTLPLLASVRVASPCSANWNDMTGDDRVRHCGACDKNVYNLSAMTSIDAELLLRANEGGELCVRFYRRADGTVMTVDCPVGVRKKKRKQLAFAAVSASAFAMTATAAFATMQQGARSAPSAHTLASMGSISAPAESPDMMPHMGMAPNVQDPVNPPAPTGSARGLPSAPKPPPKLPRRR